MSTFDDRLCTLGEGPLWHPLRKQLFWFDIVGKALLSRVGDEQLRWDFEDYVSAAGWVDADVLLIASATELFTFNVETEAKDHVCALEADKPDNRSNDGRADPYGGFWIGTMGFKSEDKAGAIYRYYRGELRKLYDTITITNATCFTPDGKWALFCDTPTQQVLKVALDGEGWPVGEPEVFVDLKADGTKADGAVVDRDGNVWIAHWGHYRVTGYTPEGKAFHQEDFPVMRISCPAFGGEDLTTLYATSARAGATDVELSNEPLAGATFTVDTSFVGQPENRVIL